MVVKRSQRRLWSWLLPAAVLVGGSGWAGAQDPSVPHIEIPPPGHSVRAAYPVAGMIQAQQDGFPAEIRTITPGANNWMEQVTVISRTRTEIVSARVGWAYAMPAGLEFHQSDVLKVQPGLHLQHIALVELQSRRHRIRPSHAGGYNLRARAADHRHLLHPVVRARRDRADLGREPVLLRLDHPRYGIRGANTVAGWRNLDMRNAGVLRACPA